MPSKTTPTRVVLANPDGTMTLKQTVNPVRVKQDGQWRPVNLDLVKRPDGTVTTVASVVDVRLSTGGSDQPLVVAARNDHEVGLRWQGELPEPVLDGPTATYPNVLPGVDLVVTAAPRGFSQVLKVNTRKAARNPKLDRITFGSHVENGSIRAVGRQDAKRLQVRDAHGRVLFAGNATRMWDSSRGGGQASAQGFAGKPAAGAPAASAHRATMAVKVTEDELSVTPDQKFLTDPDTTYPVYIDPSYYWAGGKNHHAVVQSGYPNAHNYDATSGNLGDLKAGYVPWIGISRSFVEMDLSGLRGKYIRSGTLRTRVRHSWSCNGGPTELWLTGGIGPGTTWNAQPGWARELDQTRVSNHAQYCPSQGGADFKVTGAVRQGVRERWSNITFGLRAQNEGDKYAWRRFDLNPTLEVRYNSYPNRPTALSMEGGQIPCETGADRPLIGTRTPSLRARVSDPDGGSLYDTGFRVRGGTTSSGDWVGKFVAYHTPSGSFAEVRIPGGEITSDGVYHWSVWTGDGQLRSPTVGGCEFEVDTTDPTAPSVSSAEYPYDTPAGGIGQTGTFTLSASGADDVAYYLYSFTEDQSDDPQQRVDPNRLGGEATIQWTPTLDGPQTLFVRSVDRAGNRSPIYRYKVFVKAHDPLTAKLVGHWKLNGDLTDTSGNGRTLRSVGGATATGAGYEGQGATLQGTGDQLYAADPVVDTSKSFSVAAWVKLDELGGWGAPVEQSGAEFTNFHLQVLPDGRWSMVMFKQDDADKWRQHTRVRSTSTASAGEWVHIVATYNAATDKMRLYFNGELEGEASYASTWTATGAFGLGTSNPFAGTIDEVRVYQRVLVDSEIAKLANQAVLRAHYPMNEGSGTTTTDEVTGREATFHGGPTWSAGQFTSVEFDAPWEHDEYMTASRPSIRTDHSYTVSAWVKKASGFKLAAQVVSMNGSTNAAFLLGYRAENNGWGFWVSCSSTESCGWVALAPEEATAGEWVHLTGVYNAVSNEAQLYVNGQFSAKVSGVTGWNGAGDLLIGAAMWQGRQTDHWAGNIDDVRVYSGVLSDAAIGQLAIHY